MLRVSFIAVCLSGQQQQTPITMNRHQFTKETRTAFNTAVALDIIDAVELGCMMNEFDGNATEIMESISEAAYACIHSDKSKHSKWCAIADEWFATV